MSVHGRPELDDYRWPAREATTLLARAESGTSPDQGRRQEGQSMTISPRPDADSTSCWPGFPIMPGDPGQCAGEQPGRTSAHLRRGERAIDLTAQGDNRPVGARVRTPRVE